MVRAVARGGRRARKIVARSCRASSRTCATSSRACSRGRRRAAAAASRARPPSRAAARGVEPVDGDGRWRSGQRRAPRVVTCGRTSARRCAPGQGRRAGRAAKAPLASRRGLHVETAPPAWPSWLVASMTSNSGWPSMPRARRTSWSSSPPPPPSPPLNGASSSLASARSTPSARRSARRRRRRLVQDAGSYASNSSSETLRAPEAGVVERLVVELVDVLALLMRRRLPNLDEDRVVQVGEVRAAQRPLRERLRVEQAAQPRVALLADAVQVTPPRAQLLRWRDEPRRVASLRQQRDGEDAEPGHQRHRGQPRVRPRVVLNGIIHDRR